MNGHAFLGDVGLAERPLLRGVVIADDEEGRFLVRVAQGGEVWLVTADLLVTSEAPVRLAHGDAVLCWVETDDRERGVVVGRIGLAPEAARVGRPAAAPAAQSPVPETLVIEARQSLTLRVGGGEITIREDGKILIKGKDLVSHAQRMNRIRGGAVAIN